MKSLFFCNTNYQLIIAIQILATMQKNASVIITNEIKNVKEIYDRLISETIFENVSIMDVKQTESSITILRKCVQGWLPKNLEESAFDEFIGFNFDIPSHYVFAALYKKNRNIKVNKMEEGLLSYNTKDTDCRVLNLAYRVRKTLKQANLKCIAQGFYCFQPQAYIGQLSIIKIPQISSDSDIKELLVRVFAARKLSEYKEKYLYLPGIYDVEGNSPIGELDMAIKISTIIGKDNLLVKVHPRDSVKRFAEAGFKIDSNSLIPFEIIELCGNLEDKTLITTLSGSLINFNSVLSKPFRCIYAYRLCDIHSNTAAFEISQALEKYYSENKNLLRNITVINSIREIL